MSVIESKKYMMHTTRSWEFSGVEEDKPTINDLVSRANYGKDVVIGMLDSGNFGFGFFFLLFIIIIQIIHCFPCDFPFF